MSYKSQHTVILGGGLAGLFAAEKLAEAGFAVTVVQGEPGLGEASPLAQGMICSKGLTAADSELFAAKLAGQEILRARLQAAPEIPRIEGVLEPFFDEEACNRILKRVYRKRPYFESGTVIERVGEAKRVFNPTAVHGWLRYPRDYWFDAEFFVASLRTKLVKQGVVFKTLTVRHWQERTSGWDVHGDRETISCDELVVATGAQTDVLLAASGFPTLHLIPVHGVILRGEAPSRLPSCAFVHGAKSVACHERLIQVGGTSTKEWHASDLEAHARALSEELLPFLDPAMLAGVNWRASHGVRVRVKDRMPVVGAWRSPSRAKAIYVLTGLYKNGLQVGEACAEHLARVIRGGEPPTNTRLFDSRRLL